MRHRILIFGNSKFRGFGLSLIILSYALYFFNPVEVIKSAKLTFVEGSFLYQLWQKPPVKLYINVYMFNITNSERFLSGEDEKIHVEEVGPYVYWEELVHENITFNDNGTISYIPRRKMHFDHELSISNPEVDHLFVPNLPLLGFSSLLKDSPMVVNMFFESLVEYLDSKPILNLTAHDFLWGYDDKLVSLASKMLPSWIDFTRFGMLERMLNEGTNVVTMNLPSDDENRRPYTIDEFNGSLNLSQWIDKKHPDEPNHCNLEKATEGVVYPRHITPDMNFPLYRKAFCRTLLLEFSSVGDTDDGYEVNYYKFSHKAFNSSMENNSCYCKNGECLPAGLSDLSPCYYNIPVAVSFPHFYDGDPSLVGKIDGISPEREKHESVMAIQPDIGIPLMINTRLQLNLVVNTKERNNRARKFDGLTLPVFWVHLEVKKLPESLVNLLFLCFCLGPLLLKMVILLLALVGITLIILPSVRSSVGKNKGVTWSICCSRRYDRNLGHQKGDRGDCKGQCGANCMLVSDGDDIVKGCEIVNTVVITEKKKSANNRAYSPLTVIVPKPFFKPNYDDTRGR
ncbi:scavenger receptor class B member 1-like isoform X2 [Daktulosphaira vitifoliae]|uniref:scavenger receptor class B member 1-like isoform X2 n=1 Tax=Daktulosphaira vitifoliae TaxID=58002 RepID=UPI0021AAEB6A|nr:scavenger receptor class B member 1-like isoform X2 [Daktulosphaira vitifoliae]